MAPFTTPQVIISGLKEKIDSLTIQADRLYLGSAIGNLHIYSITGQDGSDAADVELVEVKKGLTKKSIEQLGLIKDVNSLAVLSDMTVSLFALPSLSNPTALPKAKAAFSFAIHSYVEYREGAPVNPIGTDLQRGQPIPTLFTQLLVGCRRKAVIYSWKDGEPQEVKEAPLPHSARTIVFLNKDTACFAYSPTEYAIFSIPSMTATDVAIPIPAVTSGTAMGALTGLTGYMSLGLGAKAKPGVIRISDSEIVISKDGHGFFTGADTKPSRPSSIEWPTTPEELAYVKPYIISVLPSGTVTSRPTESATSTTQPYNLTSLLQVHSSLSLQQSQSIPFPFNATEIVASQNAAIRLLTPTSLAKSPLYALSTPLDRTAATNEGSSLWRFTMKSWSEQLDELVLEGRYSDALALLDNIDDDGSLLDKDQRRVKIKALHAVSQFRSGDYQTAIKTLIELHFNPAKVVALYPENIAGRLSVPRDQWIALFGGPVRPTVKEDHASSAGSTDGDKDKASQERQTTDLLDALGSGTGSVGGRLRKTGLGMLMLAQKDDDAVSITSKRRNEEQQADIEVLHQYLVDRRTELRAALEAVNITPESQSHTASPLSEASVEELFALPNAPLSALTPAQLLRFAQIVDTALYKAFLLKRPSLLGSLCRIANWCEVSEVEEDLRARKKFVELQGLYHGKKMHGKALQLLKELSEEESDMDEKLGPSIRYLQKLGQEYIALIFEYARWIFDLDKDMAFQIFTSDDVELEVNPVADFLQGIDPTLCSRFLEYTIKEREEAPPAIHDRLAELYLTMTLSAKRKGDEKTRKEVYAKLLQFLNTDDHIAVDQMYGKLSSTDLHEARAILLGRLGLHDQALKTYVYSLHDYIKAEEYCKRIYQPNTDTANIFFTLLRIYLVPTEQSPVDLLQPALELISRHSPRLDAVETLELLPPLVTMDDLKAFLVDALRAPKFEHSVVRQISKARSDQVSRRLMAMQSRSVKITDNRICPQCHKRLGNSVVAVHAPRGEVTHYRCREPFSQHLRDLRR